MEDLYGSDSKRLENGRIKWEHRWDAMHYFFQMELDPYKVYGFPSENLTRNIPYWQQKIEWLEFRVFHDGAPREAKHKEKKREMWFCKPLNKWFEMPPERQK